MSSALRRNLIIFLSIMALSLFVAGVVLAFPARVVSYADEEGGESSAPVMTLSSITADSTLKYADSSYKNTYKIKPAEIASYTANGGERSGYELAKAFDSADKTYWISQEGNTETFKNNVTVMFNGTLEFRSMSFYSCYYTASGNRNFSGYPPY